MQCLMSCTFVEARTVRRHQSDGSAVAMSRHLPQTCDTRITHVCGISEMLVSPSLEYVGLCSDAELTIWGREAGVVGLYCGGAPDLKM